MGNPKRDSEQPRLSRRQALLSCASVVAEVACSQPGTRQAEDDEPPYNALGERVGEVTDRSAIVHTRLTAASMRHGRGFSFPLWTHNLSREQRLEVRVPDGMSVADLEGSCAGRAGRVRLHYSRAADLAAAKVSEWTEVGAATDFTHSFVLEQLQPDTVYTYAVETKSLLGTKTRRGKTGSFRTAASSHRWQPIRFAAITCQDYACRDHPDGFKTYASMKRLSPAFLVSTGDNVYYDIDLPIATSVELARYHWHRMYSQPLVVEFFQTIPGYWMKDDHDSFEDDDWQTRQPLRVAPMAWQDLAPVFLEQVPIGKKTYRSFRWGKGLEIWLVETRDFRSPNPDTDGPAKTIWGAEQKAWLKKNLLASDAAFKVLISPDCIVGPGGGPGRARFELPEGGADSHGDGGFAYEGREFRHWVRENKLANLVVINGDRHWQYHSVDPETGLHEFSCGPVSDSHATDFPYDPKYHRFLRIKGGFISVSLEGTETKPRLLVQHHDVDGQVVHQAVFSR
jgi:alkaline phosphatase D